MHPLKSFKLVPTLAVVLAATAATTNAQLLVTEVQSDGLSDFWELTNVGTAAVDLSGWKWDDESRSSTDPASVTIPGGTSIAPGESIVFTATAAATFRNQWGLASTVQIIVGGPGFGMNDGIALFNAAGAEQFFFTYGLGGFTRTDGSQSAGGHAGTSAGGGASKAMVWDPSFGTTSPRYTFANGTTLGTVVAPGSANDAGSPGYSGFNAGGGGPQVALSLSATATTFPESAANPASIGTVTRATATAEALVVSLSSSDITEATVPATVTIPANQTSATFDITAVNDTFPDGGKTATLTATATNSNNPTLALTVQDDGDVLDKDFMLTELQSNQSSGKPTGANDYWELTNIGTTTRDISGYSWHDSGRSGAVAAGYRLPSGTTIAAGESVVFTSMAPAAFRAWWGLPGTVQVFQAAAAPGLGKDDGISFFDDGRNELFFFSYAAGGFTREDGSLSTGDHAGLSAGGSSEAQALVWAPASGTAAPRYVAATGSNHGTFSAVSPATDTGSPGTKGETIPTVSIGSASVTEGNSGDTTLSLNVTRSDTSTAFTVSYAVTGGSATAGTDFTLASGTLEFTSGGAATLPVQIPVHGDTVGEPDETIVVTLSNVVNTQGNTAIVGAQGTGTIVNDDPISPLVVTPPSGTTVASGGTTTLSVSASGFPAPTYQWYIGAKGDISQPIAGATSATLVTPAVTSTTSFWVRITNVAGSVDSDAGTVTVVSGTTSVDLSRYVRVGRYSLPEPKRTALPAGALASNVLCQEASGVAYNWDTDTLFIVGDGGRSVTQVSKTGQLIDTMNLAAGNSAQGTDFYDPEGITYIGGGRFVFSEERDRQLVRFTYAAGTTLSRSGAKTVKLGTFVDNIGIEGMSYDPLTGGFICMKEINPLGIFQTNIDFDAGTATNGSPTTVNSVNLFDPALMGMSDFADVFALSNLPSMEGQAQQGNLLVLSQEAARIVNTDRNGNILSTLQIVADPGSPLSVADQQHEGLTMDRAGNIYVVNENGGGSIDFPELWVYAPSSATNQAPTAVSIANPVNSIVENTNTTSRVKVGDIMVTDDGIGDNDLTLTGTDAAIFEIHNLGLYIKAGTVLDFETKTSYSVIVHVDDTTVGATPDASVNFTLTVTDVVNEGVGGVAVFISEVHPTGSSNTSYKADWFEITNAGSTDLNLTGWQVDDNSNGDVKIALRGVTSIPAGKSAVFFEGAADGSTDAQITADFCTAWFGSPTPPAGFLIGSYGGSGIGLSSGGDALNVFNAAGDRVTGVSFAASTNGVTFDNKAAIGSTTLPLPAVSTMSVSGVNGAFISANGTETGSPGTTGLPSVIISEVHPTGSSNDAYLADWIEITNTGATAINITGWQMDDNSNGDLKVALRGVTSIPAGKSAIFFEGTSTGSTDATIIANFCTAWFGSATPPAGFLIGAYGGSSVGLSSGGDAVNIFDSAGNRVTGVQFGAATSNVTFDNKAGLGSSTLPLPMITAKSTVGVNGAFASASSGEVGSPGLTGRLLITEVSPWGSDRSYAADWFEVTNGSAVTMDLTGWKMDDSSESPVAGATPLNGVTTLAPGERAVFLETTTPSSTIPAFLTSWFGANPPAGLKVGSYSGSGVGLSGSSGDAVNLYSPDNVRQANVSFGAAPSQAPFATFDNAAGTTFGAISRLSAPGVNGGFVAKNDPSQIGSPGFLANSGPLDFNLWLAVNGISSAGFSADSNGNGLKDGIDFFFNLKNGSQANLPVLTISGGEKFLTFSTLAGTSGVTGILEYSEDLGVTQPWTTATLNVDYEVVNSTTASGLTTTTLRLTGTAAAKFWRHRVTGN